LNSLTFSTGGGWFIRYADGTIRLSMKGTFPDSFHRLLKDHIVTRNLSSPQYSNIQNVWFGAGDTILIQFTNRALLWEGLPDDINQKLTKMHQDGWTLSKTTCLSPLTKHYCLLEWRQPWGSQVKWSYNTPKTGILQSLFVREVLEGNLPVSHTLSPEKATTTAITPELESICKEMWTAFTAETSRSYMTNQEFKEVMEVMTKHLPASTRDLGCLGPEQRWQIHIR
jgi:hypothetical protein